MPHQAPFTAHLRIVATRGKRFETIRSLQRLAYLIYAGPNGISGLTGNADLALAIPGGGQAAQLSSGDNQSDYISGCAYVPQFGESPAQLMITGFYLVGTAPIQPWPDQQIIYNNKFYTGAGGAWGWAAIPDPTVAAEVIALKAIFDSVILATVPNENVSLFRLDYKGIQWGMNGFTFPN